MCTDDRHRGGNSIGLHCGGKVLHLFFVPLKALSDLMFYSQMFVVNVTELTINAVCLNTVLKYAL